MKEDGRWMVRRRGRKEGPVREQDSRRRKKNNELLIGLKEGEFKIRVCVCVCV